MTLAAKKAMPQSPQGIMLFGPFAEKGVSLMRYCYKTSHHSSVADRFQNGSLLLLLNISGHAHVSYHSKKESLDIYHLAIAPQKIVPLFKKNGLLSIQREANEEHRFFILEISRSWLASMVKEYPYATKKEITAFLKSKMERTTPALTPLCSNLRLLCEELSLPQHQKDRPSLWFYAKILEFVSHTLLEPSEDFCCHRKEHIALERIEAVKKNLAKNLEHPPSLAECARAAGCSAAYLSRTFSEYTGMTISRYLRNLRLEHAAALLRSGKCNVTEAAMAVGYSSLSHFSKAFAEMFDHCPSCAPDFHKGTKSNRGMRAKTASPASVTAR